MSTTKPKKPPKKKELDLGSLLRAVDLRNYEFYESLNEKQLKEFSPYVLMRYVSNSDHNIKDIQEWYVETVNERINKNHWDLSKKHSQLLWKLYASTGVGETTDHRYLPALKYQFNKFEKLIAELNPAMKPQEVKLLASLMTDDEKKELLDNMGFDKKERKEYE
jgi:hypothetical protein